MVIVDEVIKKLETKIDELKKKLEKRRLDMVDQDGPMQSIGITATRWMVEQEIEGLDNEINRLNNGIKEIRQLINQKKRYFDKYFVTDKFEYFELGIISKDSKMGMDILRQK